MAKQSARISLIVTVHNGSRHVRLFWDSLQPARTSTTETIIVDDGSSENVLAAMPGADCDPRTTVIRHDHPRGFAVAANAGIRAAHGDFLILLNSDLILEKDCVATLVEAFRAHPNVGVVSATLAFPQTDGIQHAGIAFSETNHCHIFANLPRQHPLVCRPRDVQGVAFALIGIPRHVIDSIGLLNEGYLNSYEDFDYGFRVLKHGYRIVVCPDARAYHWERQSGTIRSIRRKDNVARLWRDWGKFINPDLPRYVMESWEHLAGQEDVNTSQSQLIINLATGRMADDVIGTIRSNAIPIQIADEWNHWNSGLDKEELWLPLILPHDAARRPQPFIYVVDQFPELRKNRYWASLRRTVVDRELVFDACGNVLLLDAVVER